MIYRNEEIDLENNGESKDVDFVDTYHVMEEFVKNGKVRSIGGSMFNATQKERLISNAEITPAIFFGQILI